METRLVDERGWIICGGLATCGSPGREADSILSRKAIPTRRSCSSGTVISCSTSSAERPRASVWTSTWGGLNSGRTSTDVFPSCVTPRAMTATPPATIRRRNLRLEPTIQRIIAADLLGQSTCLPPFWKTFGKALPGVPEDSCGPLKVGGASNFFNILLRQAFLGIIRGFAGYPFRKRQDF